MTRRKWLIVIALLSLAPLWLLAKSQNADSDNPAVLGVRGLDETDQHPDTLARDYAAVERMKKIKVSEEELKQFLAEGGLR
jgi:hypothetical protein